MVFSLVELAELVPGPHLEVSGTQSETCFAIFLNHHLLPVPVNPISWSFSCADCVPYMTQDHGFERTLWQKILCSVQTADAHSCSVCDIPVCLDCQKQEEGRSRTQAVRANDNLSDLESREQSSIRNRTPKLFRSTYPRTLLARLCFPPIVVLLLDPSTKFTL